MVKMQGAGQLFADFVNNRRLVVKNGISLKLIECRRFFEYDGNLELFDENPVLFQ
jgi:hypothetical protein